MKAKVIMKQKKLDEMKVNTNFFFYLKIIRVNLILVLKKINYQ